MSYDGVGNTVTVMNARGSVSTTAFDALNRAQVQIDALGYAPTTTFDANGRQTQVQNPLGCFVTTVYSARNKVLALVNEIGLIRTYTYDPGGRTATRRFPTGDFTTYSYDRDNREIGRTYADGTLVTQIYDPVGNLTTMADSTGTTTYAYDPLSRMSGKTDPGLLVQAYVYDAASQRTNLTDPDLGVRTYTFDLDGQNTVFQDPAGRLTTNVFDAAGRKTWEYAPFGIATSFAYDAASHLVGITGQTNTQLSVNVLSFSYDSDGNRLTIWDINGPSLTTYSYDGLDRLTQEARSGNSPHTYSYVYDPTNNMLYSGETGTTFTCNAAGEIVTSASSAGTSTFSYDPNGSLTNVVLPLGGPPITMSYDKENRLTLHRSGSTLTAFTYSGDGLKRSETDSMGTTTLVWDGDEYLQGRG